MLSVRVNRNNNSAAAVALRVMMLARSNNFNLLEGVVSGASGLNYCNSSGSNYSNGSAAVV